MGLAVDEIVCVLFHALFFLWRDRSPAGFNLFSVVSAEPVAPGKIHDRSDDGQERYAHDDDACKSKQRIERDVDDGGHTYSSHSTFTIEP